jgi:subtilase family serine protease
MSIRHDCWRTGAILGVAILLMLTVAGSAFAANGQVLANSTPRFVQSAQNLGPESPSKVINITVRLQQHNIAERDALLKQLYDPKSPLYQQWLTPAQYATRFGPTAQEATVVKDFLASHGLAVTSAHQNHFYVNAQGSVADLQKAFNVQINRFSVNGKTLYSNTSNASIAGPAAAFVSSVQGLHPVAMTPRSVRPVDPETGQPFPEMALAATAQKSAVTGPPPSVYFENQCYRGVETHAFTTSGHMPAAYYSGNRYGGPINGGYGHLPPCGYEPAAIQTAYGLSPLITAGNDGTGQTVVIVDAFGSPTAGADFGVFAAQFGLPSGPFVVYSPFGIPPYNSGWAGETTLDIEWSHAVAPGAGVALIQAIDNYDNNLQNAIQWALDNQLGNQISNSYGSDEYENDAAGMQSWDDLNAEGAALGVSIQFSTGDNGDFYRAVGAYTVSVPSDSPHATAVGGTSDFLNPDYSMKFQTGWGTDLTRIAAPTGTNAPQIPLVCASTLAPGYCFYFGGGGGQSTFFAKPTWQSSLPGTGRQQPDISMTADPYTGVTIIYSYNHPGSYSVSVIGGTSASCPMFSGVWAIVNQKSQQVHGKPAGLAAPYLYSMPVGAIKDVKQASPYTGTNLTGTIMQAGHAPLYESAAAISTPDINTLFTNAFYQGTSGRWYAISFGTDSTLLVTNGWDNVTGVGTPFGAAFVNGVVNQVH